eukprot:343774-Rhodomonas_salina.4
MSRTALERALMTMEIREAQHQRRSPRPQARTGPGPAASGPGQGDGDLQLTPHNSSHVKPKLQRPATFRGDYSGLHNILDWLYSVEKYLNQCKCDPWDFAGYARTYMGRTVQAWMAAHWPQDDPGWDELSSAMLVRYLPPDHTIRLQLMFQWMRQRRTLQQYVDQWQVLDTALKFAKHFIEDFLKVMKFVEGLREVDERRYLMDRDPETLEDLYAGVIRLRQSKTLATAYDGNGRQRPTRGRGVRRARRQNRSDSDSGSGSPDHQLLRLEGKARQKAWEEGACLGCGSKDHLITVCPNLKRAIKRFTRRYTRAPRVDKASTTAQKGSKKGRRRFNKLNNSTEKPMDETSASGSASSADEDASASSDTEPEIASSENSDPKSER